MPTESNLAAASLVHAANPLSATSRELAALAVEKPAVDDHAALKKRGAFLTRRFFGGWDKKPTLPDEAVAVAGENSPGPVTETARETATDSVQTDPEAARQELGEVPTSTPGKLAYEAAPASPAAEKTPTDAIVTVAEAVEPAPPAAPETPDAPVTPAASSAPAAPAIPASRGPRLTLPVSSKPPTTMIPTEPNPGTSTTGRASAQLTLAFEITSLQLTPYFRLGSVQLKAISNVVSLGLVAAQPEENPLAAAISFQIERVELNDKARLKSILLKPLGESRKVAEPLSTLGVGHVAITGETDDAPISVTTSGAAPTVVQLVGTFAIGAMEFTPAFEIDSLRLEPASNTVRLRVAPSSQPGANPLPPAFEIAEVQLGEGAQISGLRAVPSTSEPA